MGRIQTAAPLAGIHPCLLNPVAAQPITNGPGLVPAAVIQVALGGTIADGKVLRITAARCLRMPDHQYMTAGFQLLYNAVGICTRHRLQADRNNQTNYGRN